MTTIAPRTCAGKDSHILKRFCVANYIRDFMMTFSISQHGFRILQALRCSSSLIVFVLLVHAPVLLMDWPTWDSWIYQRSADLSQPEIVQAWLHAESRFIEGLLFTTNFVVFASFYFVAYKIQLAIALAISALLCSRFLSRTFFVSMPIATLATAVGFVQPQLSTLMSHNIAGQYLINCCLWIGMATYRIGGKWRTVGIVLVWISFDVNANLTLLLGLIAIETISECGGLKSFRDMDWNIWFRRHGLLVMCPFIYFFSRSLLWSPRGIASGYNQIIALNDSHKVLRSFIKSLVDPSTLGWGISGLFYTVSFVLVLGLLLSRASKISKKPPSARYGSTGYQTSSQLLQLVIIWVAVILPYAMVGKSSFAGESFTWEARHGLLYSFPVSASLATCIAILGSHTRIETKFVVTMIAILLGAPSLAVLEIRYFAFHGTALAEKLFVRHLRTLSPPPADRLIKLDSSHFLPSRPEYRFYELTGIFGKAYGRKIPLVCPISSDCTPFLQKVTNNPAHRLAFGLINVEPQTFDRALEQSPEYWTIEFNPGINPWKLGLFHFSSLLIGYDLVSIFDNSCIKIVKSDIEATTKSL